MDFNSGSTRSNQADDGYVKAQISQVRGEYQSLLSSGKQDQSTVQREQQLLQILSALLGGQHSHPKTQSQSSPDDPDVIQWQRHSKDQMANRTKS